MAFGGAGAAGAAGAEDAERAFAAGDEGVPSFTRTFGRSCGTCAARYFGEKLLTLRGGKEGKRSEACESAEERERERKESEGRKRSNDLPFMEFVRAGGGSSVPRLSQHPFR